MHGLFTNSSVNWFSSSLNTSYGVNGLPWITFLRVASSSLRLKTAQETNRRGRVLRNDSCQRVAFFD